jgi:NRPS condensation-like uncharacterized protein
MAEKTLPRSSSRELLVRAGKEVAKSVVVAKTAQWTARRVGITAAASTVGAATYAGALMLARKVHPQYLDPVSANQINRDPEFVMNCHIWMTTHESFSLQDLQETMQFYVDNFARFRERVVVRQWLWPYWERMPQFDMTQHIAFDSTELSHDTIQDVISLSLTQGMNPLLPLWKITIFTNYTFEDGSRGNAMLFKYHHCMGDGFSLARTMMSLDTENALSPAPVKKDSGAMHAPGDFGKAAKKMIEATTKLVGMKDDPPSSVKAANLLRPLDTRIARALTSKVPVNDIKKVAKSRGFTINDMVLGALAGALRSYQMDKGKSLNQLVDPLAGVWVALRPISEAFSAQDMTKLEEPGNRSLGCVYVRLPVALECKERIDRVQAVADEISQLKGSPEPLLAQQIMKMFGLMPTMITNPIWDAIANKISISVSNLPGPPLGWRFAGVSFDTFNIFVPPVGTISTFALITTYNGRVSLSLGMDGHLFGKEDAKFILQKFDEELAQLVSSAQPSRL